MLEILNHVHDTQHTFKHKPALWSNL